MLCTYDGHGYRAAVVGVEEEDTVLLNGEKYPRRFVVLQQIVEEEEDEEVSECGLGRRATTTDSVCLSQIGVVHSVPPRRRRRQFTGWPGWHDYGN